MHIVENKGSCSYSLHLSQKSWTEVKEPWKIKANFKKCKISLSPSLLFSDNQCEENLFCWKLFDVRVGDDDDVPNSEGRTKISDSVSSDAEVDKPEL